MSASRRPLQGGVTGPDSGSWVYAWVGQQPCKNTHVPMGGCRADGVAQERARINPNSWIGEQQRNYLYVPASRSDTLCVACRRIGTPICQQKGRNLLVPGNRSALQSLAAVGCWVYQSVSQRISHHLSPFIESSDAKCRICRLLSGKSARFSESGGRPLSRSENNFHSCSRIPR